MKQITRKLEIDAGHRLLNHEGKCRNYHGHRYTFEITCGADQLDEVGRVIDFSVVKSVVGKWLDDELDHGMILQAGDPLVPALRKLGSKVCVVDFQPTAENLAAWVLIVAAGLLASYNVTVLGVRCFETTNCWSDATRGA